MKTKLFVGCIKGSRDKGFGKREVFRAVGTPTEETHGSRYAAVIGPFRTRAAADLCAGPHGTQQTVADFERSARPVMLSEACGCN